MNETNLFRILNHLSEQVNESFDQILQNRVILTSNIVEMNKLFEQIHLALMRAGTDDPEFINIVESAQVDEPKSTPVKSLLLEINELIEEFDKFL